MKERKCTKCSQVFEASTEFFCKAQEGRLRGECKICTAKFHAANYQKTKDIRDAINRQWVKDHPQARKQHTKTYRENNKDKCKAAVKAWHAKDPEHARAINREKTKRWFLRHIQEARARRRAAVKRRRALKRGAGISKLTHIEWVLIQELYKHRCAYCGRRRKGHLTQDHVIPLSKGGEHTCTNVVPACMTCNCSKKASASPIHISKLKFLQPLLL